MLDSETRRRIDTARDILVGKVPDPKSQVEQITIALVYKFMDDMDMQSVEMGGKRSFFKGKFEKYSWSNIFDPRLGGIEMLALYGEAITSMSQNDNLPQLFRDIFKNAFLPYRDPETLKLFLKTINEFTYDHSEKLGDAFEYLLSVLGSQGDAGQFRTPRHIIDFMVHVIAPQKHETVLDPACGTAGFLISAYKHILKSNQDAGKPLTIQEKQRVYENFIGYDISPDMVRLSLVNLYLHGFVKPQIHEYDTLASEDRWNDYADVILANPPFMSPKGGIQPHKRFSVQSSRSEVLFVDYMAEHLTPNGRAAIIVPEGIIFQSGSAYKQLRKFLVEQNYLWAVVSLPAGVFNPYAGVKTSILFLDRALAKKTDQILFVKVSADGFDLGAQRRPVDRNDLPGALNILNAWKETVASGKVNVAASQFLSASEGTAIAKHPERKQSPVSEEIASSSLRSSSQRHNDDMHLLVSTSRLAENGDYNLSADRYREVKRVGKQSYPMVALGELCEILDSKRVPIRESERKKGEYPYYGATGILDYVEGYLFDEKLVLVGEDGAKWDIGDKTAFIAEGKYWVNNHAHVLRPKRDLILDEYLVGVLVEMDLRPYITGVTVPKLNQEKLRSIQIPLPPLEIQRQIVDEIAAHQRIIDGARQVVEGWKPTFEVKSEWEITKIGDICKQVQYGLSEKMNTNGKGYKTFRMNELINGFARDNGEMKYSDISEKEFKKYKLNKGDLLFNRTNSVEHVGRTGIFTLDGDYCFASYLIRLVIKDCADPAYVNLYMNTEVFQSGIKQFATRAIGQANINATSLQSYKIPLPPLSIQREIVARIERERTIVEGNRELIRIYEEKIKKVIERVWGA